jgi:hypothetical protein
MPTDIERFYLEQSYVLPAGLTWSDVAEQRARWDINPVFVPLARVPGACVGWGVPLIDGEPLKHPEPRRQGPVWFSELGTGRPRRPGVGWRETSQCGALDRP